MACLATPAMTDDEQGNSCDHNIAQTPALYIIMTVKATMAADYDLKVCRLFMRHAQSGAGKISRAIGREYLGNAQCSCILESILIWYLDCEHPDRRCWTRNTNHAMRLRRVAS